VVKKLAQIMESEGSLPCS